MSLRPGENDARQRQKPAPPPPPPTSPNQRGDPETQAPGNSAKARRAFLQGWHRDSIRSLRGDVWGQAVESSRMVCRKTWPPRSIRQVSQVPKHDCLISRSCFPQKEFLISCKIVPVPEPAFGTLAWSAVVRVHLYKVQELGHADAARALAFSAVVWPRI